MKILLFCLLLSPAALALPQSPPEVYPPDGSVLLQQSSPEVTLRWKLPRGQYTAELWSEGNKISETSLTDSSWSVPVQRGQNYGWILRTAQGVYSQGRFSLAKEFTFSDNGRDGTPGRPGPAGGPGQPGTNGGQIEAELRRDEAGMHLRIHTQTQDLHYLFAEPGLRFKINAKGGDGGKGANGDDFRGYQSAVGRDGGAAGWGGNLKITTFSAPWRDYLDVDLTAGNPGAGGKGGEYYGSESTVQTAPDGKAGKPGQGGRVDTHLGE